MFLKREEAVKELKNKINKTKKSGDNFIILSKELSKKGSRSYFVVDCEDFINEDSRIKKSLDDINIYEWNNHYHEIITEMHEINRPCKLLLDVDFSVYDEKTKDLTYKTILREQFHQCNGESHHVFFEKYILDHLISIVYDKISEMFDDVDKGNFSFFENKKSEYTNYSAGTLKNGNLIILNSSDNKKYSYHIIFPSVMFTSTEALRSFTYEINAESYKRNPFYHYCIMIQEFHSLTFEHSMLGNDDAPETSGKRRKISSYDGKLNWSELWSMIRKYNENNNTVNEYNEWITKLTTPIDTNLQRSMRILGSSKTSSYRLLKYQAHNVDDSTKEWFITFVNETYNYKKDDVTYTASKLKKYLFSLSISHYIPHKKERIVQIDQNINEKQFIIRNYDEENDYMNVFDDCDEYSKKLSQFKNKHLKKLGFKEQLKTDNTNKKGNTTNIFKSTYIVPVFKRNWLSLNSPYECKDFIEKLCRTFINKIIKPCESEKVSNIIKKAELITDDIIKMENSIKIGSKTDEMKEICFCIEEVSTLELGFCPLKFKRLNEMKTSKVKSDHSNNFNIDLADAKHKNIAYFSLMFIIYIRGCSEDAYLGSSTSIWIKCRHPKCKDKEEEFKTCKTLYPVEMSNKNTIKLKNFLIYL